MTWTCLDFEVVEVKEQKVIEIYYNLVPILILMSESIIVFGEGMD
jgi:hypothetical protein